MPKDDGLKNFCFSKQEKYVTMEKNMNKQWEVRYMKHNKTDTALAIFDSTKDIVFPDYILEAIQDE